MRKRNYGTSCHNIFLVRKRNCGTSSNTVLIFLVRNYETSSHYFLVQKRNCGTSGQVFSLCGSGSGIVELQVKYIPCAKAELRNFRSSIFLLLKRNCRGQVFSLCESGLQNFRSSFFVRKRNGGTSGQVFVL